MSCDYDGDGPLLVGVDVGGTKIAAGLADGAGRIIDAQRVPTPDEGGPRVVKEIVGLARSLLSRNHLAPGDIAAVGVAVPAVIEAGRGAVLWAPNIAGWQAETPVTGPIAQALGIRASLHYDGHAWVAGEWWCGAARGARHAALIAVGTGIGGGLILDGRLHRGSVGVAGAIGWWVTDWRQGGARTDSDHGWLESLASGPAIARAAGTCTAEGAFSAARSGDDRANAAVAQAAQVLGCAVANLVSLTDPDVVVLAGGVIAGGGDLILPRVREIVAREAQPQMARRVRVVAAELGDEAGWLGAARLAEEA